MQLPRELQLQLPHVLPQLRRPRRRPAVARHVAPLQPRALAHAQPTPRPPVAAGPVHDDVCARRCASGARVGSPARIGRRYGAGCGRGAARAQGSGLLLRRGGPTVVLPAQLRRGVIGFGAGAIRGVGAAREGHGCACISLRMRGYILLLSARRAGRACVPRGLRLHHDVRTAPEVSGCILRAPQLGQATQESIVQATG